MFDDKITVFAETTFRNRKQKFGIKEDDRRRHMYLIGKTGMGKSTVMENMIVHDIRAGKGVAVVDPHGDLAEKVMQFIPQDRIKDVIYFNPGDMEFPIAFNIVEQVDPRVRHLVASGLIGVFKKLWADSWGPRLEYILRNAILAILDYPDSTLLGVVKILSDKVFRKKVLTFVTDPVVKAFWEKEFAGYADKFASEAVSPIQNKVGQFLSSSLIRNIVGQKSSALDMRKIMDEGKILIMNLSKGHIGEDNSALLGAMMITKIQLAAMSRVNIPEPERRDFYLYIDEFQNFSTESFATILSEARKYRLDLIMAHQYIEQLDEKVAAAVFGNVGTMICFRVGATDAEELVKEFTPTFMQEDILNIPKYEFYLKLMIDGVASDPFSARGLPPLTKEELTGALDKCIEYSREVYARPREQAEKDIMSAHFTEDPPPNKKAPGTGNNKFNPKGSVATAGSRSSSGVERTEKPFSNQGNSRQDNPERRTEATRSNYENKKIDDDRIEVACSSCGEKTRVNFKPDGVRPVYCQDCLSELKRKKREGFDTKQPAKNVKGNFLANFSPSQVEQAIVSEAKEKGVDTGEVSLNSLMEEKKLVDFSGRKIKIPEELKNIKKEESPNVSKEKEIEEGKDIFFE